MPSQWDNCSLQAIFVGLGAKIGEAGAKIGEVVFNSNIQYLLIVLEEGTTREQLESVEMDFFDVSDSHYKDLMLVTVTARSLSGTFSLLGRRSRASP